MALITSFWLIDFILIICTYLVFAYLRFKLRDRYFWKKQNIPYIEPTFIFGNSTLDKITASPGTILYHAYSKYKEHKVLGWWSFQRPLLLINDLDLVKKVLAGDFQHFHDRGIFTDIRRNPLSANLFNMTGQRWRNLRVKLTPTFTSGKMKVMYPTMLECGKELENYLENFADNNEIIEIKEIAARFTTDVISSCAFGIQTNSLRNPDAEFRKHGKVIFRTGPGLLLIRALLNTNLIFLFKYLPVRRLPKETLDFIMNVVKETIEYRETNNVKRKDFMDLLIQLKNKGYIDSADHYSANGEEITGDKFTFEQVAAQAFVFFAAGFETSSTTMQFAFYELALNPEIQKKLQEEIDTVMKKHNNEITYDSVQEMTYLDNVINETLRKYPPVPVLNRICTKDYTFPDTDMRVKKGTSVIISVRGIHHDPKYYPNPEKFDPDRFTPEEKTKRDRYLHMPFGEGPRICIGSRFGLMQTKTGLINVLSKYNVSVCEKTHIPLEYDPKSLTLSPLKNIYLRISKRNKN